MKRLVLALALPRCPRLSVFGAQTPAPAASRRPRRRPTMPAACRARPPTARSKASRSTRALPEKKADTRQFPEQTRAPYHHATDFKMTVLTDKLHATWASALLPDGNLLVTERLPGAFRIVGKNGAVGAAGGAGGPACFHAHDRACWMWCWIPNFASNHTIFFTYFEYLRQDRLQHRHRARRAGRECAAPSAM